MERNTGLRAILTRPQVYAAFQRLLGATKARRVFVERYVRVEPGARVLDIGCGPGVIVEALPAVDYVGFDPSASYIEAARKRFGDRAQFFVGEVQSVDPAMLGKFDCVIAVGVLHHLDDAGARQLFATASTVLRDNGRVVTIDGCFSEQQSRLSRAIVARDRGEHVRTGDQYRALAQSAFEHVVVYEHHDLLTIPYCHAVLEASGVRQPVPQPAGAAEDVR